MSKLRRRLSPSTLIATLALVAATGGTAIAAGEIITSPTQVANRVIQQRHEVNPTLRYSVASNGDLLTGDMGGDPQHVDGSNRYDLSFSSSDLGPNKLNTCAFVVSPRFDFTTAPGHNGHLNTRAYVNYARGSNTFQVFTFEQRPDGAEVPAEAAFDAVVSC
jgi:hypothetical protein